MTFSSSNGNRKKFSLRTIVLALLCGQGVFFLLAGRAAAEGGTTLTLGNVSALPKSEVLVPLLLAPDPPGLQIGSVSATVNFENKSVTFLRAEKGFLLDGVNGGFQADLAKDPADAAKSQLKVTVATKGEPRKPLREGLLITLVFQIAETAAPETKVSLDLDHLSATDVSNPPKAITPLQAESGSVEVIPPEQVPYVPCFFFTH